MFSRKIKVYTPADVTTYGDDEVNPALAGSAAGFMGFGQWLIAAVTAQVVGMIQNGTVWPTMVVVIGFTVLSGVSYLLARWGDARAPNTSSRPSP